jgi:hypothetical protein
VVARILTIADGSELRSLCRNGQQAARCPGHATIGSVSPLLRIPCRMCVPRARGALAGRLDEAASGSFATAIRVLAAYDALTTG